MRAIYVTEIEAELQASEECFEAAKVGLEEMRIRRSVCWGELLDAVQAAKANPDDRRAKAKVARALGAMARTELATAETAVALRMHRTALQRQGRL